jgi:hypothetical protein
MCASAITITAIAIAVPIAVRTRYAAWAVSIIVVPNSPGRVAGEVEIIHPTGQISATSSTVVWSPHVVGNRRRLSESPVRLSVLLLIDQNNHPDPYASALTQKRCAMYPARSSFLI